METPLICFTLEQATRTRIPNVFHTFIVQNEDRKFLVFKSVDDYLEKIKTYSNCHEVIVSKDGKAKGRLVFDFDLSYENMTSEFPSTFCHEIQETIKMVFKNHYSKTPSMKFVWLKCENKKKISFHLIVKGAYFADDWKLQMSDFYSKMKDEMSKNSIFSFYNGDIIDAQIARQNATLRMPLNSKKDGNPLLFYYEKEEDKFEFYDGLIGVYRFSDLTKEMHLFKTDLLVPIEDKKYTHVDIDFDPDVIFRKFQSINDGKFKMGNVNGNYITLLRKKPSYCLIDKTRYHEHENSYLVVNETGIWFGCYRNCTCGGKKTILIEKREQEKSVLVPVEKIEVCPAFTLFENNKYNFKNWFVQGKIKNEFVEVKRVSPGLCPLSGEHHDKEGGYLLVKNNYVYYGCQDKSCLSTIDKKKTKYIGKL